MELRIKNLVDVCVGPMTLSETLDEIENYLKRNYDGKVNSRVVVDIKREGKDLYTAIYIPLKDFERR